MKRSNSQTGAELVNSTRKLSDFKSWVQNRGDIAHSITESKDQYTTSLATQWEVPFHGEVKR